MRLRPDCSMPGRVSVDAAAGPIMVCVNHLDEAMQYSRQQRLEVAGRPTRQDSIARMHALLKGRGRTPLDHWQAVGGALPDPAAGQKLEREPGQDDEERSPASPRELAE